jgi:hypothetical protein
VQKRSRRTTRKTSSTAKRRAPKRKAAKRAAPRAAKKRTARKKAPKKYTRYDPLTGQKAKVTADDPRYTEWLPRKPGKKKIRQERAAELLGGSRVAGVIAEEVGRKAAQRAATVAKTTGRKVAGQALGAVGATAALSVAAQAAAVATAGALAYGLTRLILTHDAGANLDKAYREYSGAKRALMAQTGSSSWADVPKAARDRLHAAYQEAVVRAKLGPLGTGTKSSRSGGGLL